MIQIETHIIIVIVKVTPKKKTVGVFFYIHKKKDELVSK